MNKKSIIAFTALFLLASVWLIVQHVRAEAAPIATTPTATSEVGRYSVMSIQDRDLNIVILVRVDSVTGKTWRCRMDWQGSVASPGWRLIDDPK